MYINAFTQTYENLTCVDLSVCKHLLNRSGARPFI